jgi:hypothetical protein
MDHTGDPLRASRPSSLSDKVIALHFDGEELVMAFVGAAAFHARCGHANTLNDHPGQPSRMEIIHQTNGQGGLKNLHNSQPRKSTLRPNAKHALLSEY